MKNNRAQIAQAITLIETRTGLSARTLERIGIEELLLQLSGGKLDDYIRNLHRQPETNPDWQRLIHTLTIGETYFMRDQRHFEILRETILPQIILQHRRDHNLSVTVWCAGCATGEEPYSIAITLHEFLPDIANWRVRIIATDLNERALQVAQRGIYRQWSFRQSTPQFQQRYFTTRDDGWQINDNIRSMVTFQHSNLITSSGIPAADLILCRNVLLYFSPPFVQRAENRLYDVLTPGGWLMLGQSEALRSNRERWIMHIFPGTSIYQKPSEEVPLTKPISWISRPKITEQPGELQSVAYQRAVAAVQKDQLMEAEYHLAQHLEEYPDQAEGHTLLAFILANRQAFPEAEAHIEIALAHRPLAADAYYIRALIHLEQGRTDEAINALNGAIYCQREHTLAHFVLGNLYASRGDIIRAYRSWRNSARTLANRPADDFVSDLSEMTVTSLRTILQSHLSEDPDF
jgi:chemotaxis protein methyltransferase CheR